MHLVRQKVWFIKPIKIGFFLTTIEDTRNKRKSCYHKKSNEVLIALLTTVMLKMCKKVITVIDTGGYISIFQYYAILSFAQQLRIPKARMGVH